MVQLGEDAADRQRETGPGAGTDKCIGRSQPHRVLSRRVDEDVPILQIHDPDSLDASLKVLIRPAIPQ
jgi:hypothetical protein